MNPVIYGIPNCDSIKKARKWFEAESIEYEFIDVRKTPPSKQQVTGWIRAVGEPALVNKRSTTWKNMSDAERETVLGGGALDVLLANPTLIKRPVLEYAGETSVGFKADDYAARFNR